MDVAMAFANIAPVQWEETIDRMPDGARHQLETHARAAAVHYARIAAYVGGRNLGADHAAAVQHQNSTARAVRKALGFSYPADPITF
jgi:hypothetical protein